MSNCTFKPKINERSISRSRESIHDNLYSGYEKMRNKTDRDKYELEYEK